jgi:hypothetical protein
VEGEKKPVVERDDNPDIIWGDVDKEKDDDDNDNDDNDSKCYLD